ncbi:hypothetical protein [Candidatus Jidaibacter acanthamoebae]|nr:hypothetical protein [Candidatus Jidaibacter acanthamoeba]
MQQKVLDFFSFYSKSFRESNATALCNMHYIPNTFIFNILNKQIKEFTIPGDLQSYLKEELTEQLSIEQTDENSIEIMRVHFINNNMLMAEVDWSHYLKDASDVVVIKCLFVLVLVGEELKIASTTFV